MNNHLKISKYRVWKGLTAALAVFLAVLIFLTVLCFDWKGNINVVLGIRPPVEEGESNTMYYGTAYSDDGVLSDEALAKMLEASDAHDIQTMEEGAVLLKNNGALPLSSTERNVTLFGRAVADPVYRGNSGGAGIDRTRLVTLHSALESEDFNINETLFSAYENSSTSRIKGKTAEAWDIGEEDISFYTNELKDTWATSYNDVAIVMFSRDGGEGNDLSRSDKDGISLLALHDSEKELLEMIESSGKFEKTIVLINSAYPMELGWLEDDLYGVDAALWIGGTGLKGFAGVANILVGKADPSGHFVDTYAADSLSAPAVQNFGDFTYTNASEITADSGTHYVVYAEGIYVGYKYYETRYQDQVLGINNASGSAGVFDSDANSWDYADEMVYTFGYGSSYATFTQTVKSIAWDRTAHTVTAVVTVKNVSTAASTTYTGKSKTTVQLYVQLPYESGMAQKSAIQLIGYEKSGLLAAGESEDVTVTVDDYLFATYDENATNGADTSKKGCYVFDEGDYYFAIGDDAHDALNNVLAYKLADDSTIQLFDASGAIVTGDEGKVYMTNLATLDNTTYATSRETGEVIYNKLQYADINSYGDFVTYLNRDDWNTYPISYTNLTATTEMMADLEGEAYVKSSTAAAYDSSLLGQDKGISLIEMKDVAWDDDEAWNDFLYQMTLTELCSIIGEAFGQPAIESINKPANTNSDGPSGAQGSYQYGNRGSSTEHVNEVVAASTWNKQILEDRGSFIGEDCLFVGTTQLWSPGGDLHRTPFSGRNFEYYSEDSIMSYICASEQVAAMQAKGVNTAIKHFCANDQETNRTGLSTFMTEQTYRQGPLKGFEGAFTVGGVLSTMIAMGRIGCSVMYEDYGTLTEVMRGEWGWKGVNITDSAISQHAFETIESFMAGTDTFNADAGRSNQVQSYIISKRDGDVLAHVIEVNKRFYYSMVRSNLINGLSVDKEIEGFVPWWQPTIIVIDCVVGVVLVGCTAMYVLNFVKKEKEKE